MITQRHPILIIPLIAATPEHAIDERTPSKGFALWQMSRAAIEASLGGGRQILVVRSANTTADEERYPEAGFVAVRGPSFD